MGVILVGNLFAAVLWLGEQSLRDDTENAEPTRPTAFERRSAAPSLEPNVLPDGFVDASLYLFPPALNQTMTSLSKRSVICCFSDR